MKTIKIVLKELSFSEDKSIPSVEKESSQRKFEDRGNFEDRRNFEDGVIEIMYKKSANEWDVAHIGNITRTCLEQLKTFLEIENFRISYGCKIWEKDIEIEKDRGIQQPFGVGLITSPFPSTLGTPITTVTSWTTSSTPVSKSQSPTTYFVDEAGTRYSSRKEFDRRNKYWKRHMDLARHRALQKQ